MNEFLVSANDAHSGNERRMKAAWEGGRWVCVPLLQARERGEKGKRGGGVVRANEPRSGSEGGQQSGST